MRNLFVKIIHLYQRTLSPDHGWFRAQHPLGYCRFYPSCSEYMKQSITQHGSGRGIWHGLLRLARCHPWSRGGLDPIRS